MSNQESRWHCFIIILNFKVFFDVLSLRPRRQIEPLACIQYFYHSRNENDFINLSNTCNICSEGFFKIFYSFIIVHKNILLAKIFRSDLWILKLPPSYTMIQFQVCTPHAITSASGPYLIVVRSQVSTPKHTCDHHLFPIRLIHWEYTRIHMNLFVV